MAGMTVSQQTLPQPRSLSLESPAALWGAFFLSMLLHGGIVGLILYQDWLNRFQFRPEMIEDKQEDFHAVGLYVKPPPEQESRNNPDGAETDATDRPDARFSTNEATVTQRKEVPERPPVNPLLPGEGKQTVGPGNPVPSPFGGKSDGFVVPNGVRNAATAAARSTGDGDATFFTINDKGKRIVYVLDRSGSMIHNDALLVAKQQLIFSLNRLSPKHQFQIIFYDENAYVLKMGAGDKNRLSYATSRNIEKVKVKISAIQPKGGTRHMAALRPALELRPDVIFFLTDADSSLDAGELNEIRLLNKGKSRIHCIEFGKGPDLTGDGNFLKRLADMTGGKHTYRDVQKFQKR